MVKRNPCSTPLFADGAQREGISLSAHDKQRIAEKLDQLGVAYIRGGCPGSNPKDVEFFERVKR
jgi:2-isopropylmalate synthase